MLILPVQRYELSCHDSAETFRNARCITLTLNDHRNAQGEAIRKLSDLAANGRKDRRFRPWHIMPCHLVKLGKSVVWTHGEHVMFRRVTHNRKTGHVIDNSVHPRGFERGFISPFVTARVRGGPIPNAVNQPEQSRPQRQQDVSRSADSVEKQHLADAESGSLNLRRYPHGAMLNSVFVRRASMVARMIAAAPVDRLMRPRRLGRARSCTFEVSILRDPQERHDF